jgi:carboxyl-terminal processing protease
LLYLEAVTRIKDNSIFLEGDTTRKEIVQDTLKAYLNAKDAFSGYLTREEYLRFKESQDEKYVGIGMEIEKNIHGEIVCFPYPESVAERAGIRNGDRLKSIDQVPVYGKSILAVATLARGRQGTQVDLVITHKNGKDVPLRLTRSDVQFESISRKKLGNISVLKILSFSRIAKAKIESILNAWDKDTPLVIDLRGNPGGDLNAAVDSAMLFLEKGKKILSIRARNGSKTYKSRTDAVSFGTPIILWQDEVTASAAEVFITALTENGRAISIGTKTFGKGTKQDIVELSDGSALVLTTGYLQTPDRREFEGNGISPSYQLATDNPDTAHYLAKTAELISRKSEGISFAL